jgi:hypothetical protein
MDPRLRAESRQPDLHQSQAFGLLVSLSSRALLRRPSQGCSLRQMRLLFYPV